MLLKEILEIYDLIDRPNANGLILKEYLETKGKSNIIIKTVTENGGSADFIKIIIKGTKGKANGGKAKTLGILGSLGGVGARPEMIGTVSDGDGAIVALAIASKLIDMQTKGDFLEGDIIISTHICPNAPTTPHDPVPFMGSFVEMETTNKEQVDKEMDAILSIDTTKGNRVINTRGFAISPTIKSGYILKTSEDLLNIMEITTGKLPIVFPVTTQDITPYGNDIHHLNSILQPSTATNSSVVGVAITTEVAVPGCATGASHPFDLESAGRFTLEVAKSFGRGNCNFYDEEEFKKIISLYGHMNHLQTLGKNPN